MLALLYVVLAFLFSRVPSQPIAFEGEKKHTIYVHSNGVHLDIVLKREDLNQLLLTQLNLAESSGYVSLGWGDKGFYLHTPEWKDLKFTTAFNAMFLPSSTAMHVTEYSKKQKNWFLVKIGEEQLEILNTYISESFSVERNAILKIENPGNYKNDNFYEANGSYHLVKTCNIWVSNALKRIGVKTSFWSPFDWGVLHFLKKEDKHNQ